jgi:hypothetical protein
MSSEPTDNQQMFNEIYSEQFQKEHAEIVSLPNLDNVSLMTSGQGLRFGRLIDGSVVILADAKSLPDCRTYVIPENIWASIVAHVSVTGEVSGKWFHAMNLHNDPTATVMVIRDGGIEKS